jgi:Flp pilus assembly pilin Flp
MGRHASSGEVVVTRIIVSLVIVREYLARPQRGQSMAEYAFILGAIAAAAFASYRLLGSHVGDPIQSVIRLFS